MKNNIKVQVWADYHGGLHPREDMDNTTTMAFFHNRYDLGDTNHGYNSDDYESWSEMEAAIRESEDVLVLKKVYMYDHSGITISTTPFNCQWDSGVIGFVWISRESAKLCWGEHYEELVNNTKKAEEILESEIDVYDAYIRGNVYGFSIIREEECNLGCLHEDAIESCGGFFITKGMNFEDMIEDMKRNADPEYHELFDKLTPDDIVS